MLCGRRLGRARVCMTIARSIRRIRFTRKLWPYYSQHALHGYLCSCSVTETYDLSLTSFDIDSPKKMTSGLIIEFVRSSRKQLGQSGTTNWSYLVPSGRTTCIGASRSRKDHTGMTSYIRRHPGSSAGVHPCARGRQKTPSTGGSLQQAYPGTPVC